MLRPMPPAELHEALPGSRSLRLDLLIDRAIVAGESLSIALTGRNGAPAVAAATDWGDGIQTVGPVAHAYLAPTQDVQITARALNGDVGASRRFDVLPRRVDHPGAIRPVYYDFPTPDLPFPVAAFTYTPPAPRVGVPMLFDGGGSTPDPGIDVYEWQLTGTGGGTAQGRTISFTPPDASAYVMRLTVRLADGRSANTSRMFDVAAVDDSEAPGEEPDETPPDEPRSHRRARQH